MQQSTKQRVDVGYEIAGRIKVSTAFRELPSGTPSTGQTDSPMDDPSKSPTKKPTAQPSKTPTDTLDGVTAT
jgi:hypothetical protein